MLEEIERSGRFLCLFRLILTLAAAQFLWMDTAPALGSQGGQSKPDIREAIVKIYTVASTPDYYNPWRMSPPMRQSGSGCIIEGNRVLTNAHTVANHTFVQVRRYGQAERHKAKVLWVSHDVDLALVTTEDSSLFESVKPLAFGALPNTQQEVVVYGFPIGGDSLSITKGVLSRLEHQYYVHSSGYYLSGQIDAAINPGNSGGPVVVDGQVVGVVMQGLSAKRSENIGYMVPVPIIEHFFEDIEDGTYDGFPAIGIIAQDMENPGMKRRYGLADDQSGVVVNHVFHDSPAAGLIKANDVILSIEGHPIAGNGTVEFRAKERTSYKYYLDMHQLGERADVQILREGKIMDVAVSLTKTQRAFSLVPAEQYDQRPRYFIYGGVVLSPLTKSLLKQWGKDWRRNAPLHLVNALSDYPTEEQQEIVVVLQVLASDINVGYHNVGSWILDRINGEPLRDFNDALRIVADATGAFIQMEDNRGYQLVLDRSEAQKSHQSILDAYEIESDRSSDLQEGPSSPDM